MDLARIITISDDLESFFHVMLYFAIRFLPHNGSNVVKELLHSYFDAYTNSNMGQTSGSTKFMAMHNGKIHITHFTTGSADEFLTFLWPDVKTTSSGPAEEVMQHHIDLIFTDLLQWFKALYAQGRKVVTKRLGATSDAEVHDDLSLVLPGMQLPAVPLISPAVQIQPTESKRLAQLELAKNLKTHDAMIQLLTQYITQVKWPNKDKGEDKKPKNGYTPPKDNIPATSTQIGSKRVVQGGAEPSSKRVRSKARA